MISLQVALGSFAAYVLSGEDHVLTANKAFVSLSLFNLLNYPLSILPGVITFAVQAGVSLGRLNKFLRSSELDPNSVAREKTSGKTWMVL